MTAPRLEQAIAHELKCWRVPFQAILDGRKAFEFRKNDRGYKVGDTLRLREWVYDDEAYTGREASALVTYMVEGPSFGVPEGYVVMSIAVPALAQRCKELEALVRELAQEPCLRFGNGGCRCVPCRARRALSGAREET